jgi:hypothetical protein
VSTTRDYISMADFTDATRAALRALAAGLGIDDLDSMTAIEQWAWFWFRLRGVRDTPERFPAGKWATIQHLESLLIEAARSTLGGLAS